MKPKPYSMVAALSENVIVFLFNYAGNELDFDTDKSAFKTELEKHFLVNTTLGFLENGIGVTGTDHTITGVADKRIITLTATEDISSSSVVTPLILYKGTAIPFSDFDTAGFAAGTCITTLKDTPPTDITYPSVDGNDYVVYYWDPLLGVVTSIEAPNVNLPLETNSFDAVGHDSPVIKVTKRGDPDASGSITVIEDQTSHIFFGETSAQNNPGEDLLSRVYGSDYTPGAGYDGSWNKLGAPTNPFGIFVLMLSGDPLAGGGQAGKVWGVAQAIYHCRLTNISPPQNITGDTTDPILRGVEFECQFPDQNEIFSIYTSA